MRSIGSFLFAAGLKIMNRKQYWEKTEEEFLDAIRKKREKGTESPPKWVIKRKNSQRCEWEGHIYYRIHSSKRKPVPIIFYFHGGGYVNRITFFHWTFLRKIAKKAEVEFIVPLYPLAPTFQHAYTFSWINHLYSFITEGKKCPVIIMGDSAGGGMALAFAQLLKVLKKDPPQKIILISPWLDATLTHPSLKKLAETDFFLALPGLKSAAALYAGDCLADRCHLVSPIIGDLDVGPLCVIGGSHDLLSCDARRLIKIAEIRNIFVEYVEFPGMMHVFPLFFFRESRQARKWIVERINASGNRRSD
ncbi:alpha/beta hydrolase fold domain-containing protein [Bacillus sp. 1P06AnD]|uniref:alpha/beta hydrolase fold domain-containing protein n=1 Tax=Bacillus sp. 1P06AnD TaxID=3132208 RepID=UPI00399FAB90